DASPQVTAGIGPDDRVESADQVVDRGPPFALVALPDLPRLAPKTSEPGQVGKRGPGHLPGGGEPPPAASVTAAQPTGGHRRPRPWFDSESRCEKVQPGATGRRPRGGTCRPAAASAGQRSFVRPGREAAATG